MKRLFSMFLAVLMVLSMVPASSLSAWAVEEPFDTENFKGLVLTTTVSGLSVKLFDGNTDDAPEMTPVYTEGNDLYFEVEAGGKYYYIAKPASGNSRYNIRKNIYITAEEAATKTVLDVTPHTRSTAGWDTYKEIIGYSDETMAAAYPSSPELWPEYSWAFETPVFTNPRNPHQQTTQTEMMDYINALDTADDNMYVFTLGKSGGSKASEIFDIPVVFYSTTDLSGAKTWEEAAALLRGNGKLSFLYQALIHGLEPGGGEAALSMLKGFDGEYGETLLPNMNICVIPRLNPYGVYMTYRQVYANGEKIDANRDFLKLESIETQLRTRLYNALQPEVCYDGHECNLHPEYETINLRDVWMSTNFTPKATEAYKDLALTISYAVFDKAKENNLSYGWYSSCINGYSGNISSSNISMRGSLIFLNESMGIAGGMQQMERRIMSHVTTVTGVLDYVNANIEQVQQVVDEQRADIVNRGKTYEQSDIIVMETDYTMHPEHYIQGKKVDTCSGEITDAVLEGKIYDVVKKSRVAPTAYVIPAEESWTADVLSMLDIHGISYTYIPAGATVQLQQYSGNTTTATLSAEKAVSFSKGAYVMTLAQENAYILALLMEPDVKDVADFGGTFAQQGLIPSAGGSYPIYRYIHDLNSENFIDYTVETVVAKEVTVYWDPANGLDTNDGLTESAPVKTVEAAYAALSGADEGNIVLLSTATFTADTTFPACDIPVTITAKNSAHGFSTGNHVFFGGDTVLDNMTLTLTKTSNAIYFSGEGHDLTIGAGIKTVSTDGSSRFCLSTHKTAGDNGSATLTVMAGNWRNIFVGGHTGENTGNATLNMSGGNVNNLVGPTFSGKLTGNTTMNISGGTLNVLMAGANESGWVKGNTDITVSGGTISKIRLRRVINSKVIPIYGTVTVNIDGDCSNVKKILDESASGSIDKTVLVLKSGTLAITPTAIFDETRVEIPAGKTLTLNGTAIKATSVNSQGKLIFSGAATLTADSITGTLNCEVADDVKENHPYVTAPATSSVTFPEATGITGAGGVWKQGAAFDTENFVGLVLKTTAPGISVKFFQNYNTTDDKLIAPVYAENTEDGGTTYYYEIKALNRYYLIAKPVSGYDRYNNHYNLYFTEEEAATKTVMDVTPNKRSTNGWDPSTEIRHRTDEVMDNVYPSDASLWPQYAEVFTTPAFREGRNEHMQTTQTEMEDFIAAQDDPDDNMYVFTLGQSAGKAFDIPLVIFTTVDLSHAQTLEEAAAIIRADSAANNKLTVHHQAQIHGNEPAAGEAALGMILRLDSQYGQGLLDTMNIYMIPRLSPYGAYKSQRAVAVGSSTTDPNRDFMRLKTQETQLRMYAYNLFDPEVVFDSHEYQESLQSTSHKRKDLMLCTHWVPQHSEAYQETALDLAYSAFDQITKDGLYYSWYSDSVGGMGANTGSSNTAFRSALHILMETSGINQGLLQYERRVATHISALTGLYAYLDANAADIRNIVHTDRAALVEDGKTYREDDIIILDATTSDHKELNIQGKNVNLYNGTLTDTVYPAYVPDVVKRSRVAPTAYVIPAGESYTEQVLKLADMQGISYTYIPENSALLLQQYTGTVELADLAEEKLTYFPQGAYVFTMNQLDKYILAYMMEPDVNDTATDKGTLAQQGIITPTNGVFPIYRYIHDLNEENFVDYTIVEIPMVEITVYLDGTNGLDTNDGLTEATPVKTIEQAYALMQAALEAGGKGSNGTVVISGLYDLGAQQSNLPAANFPVSITGKTADDGFLFTGGAVQAERTFEIHGDTTFRNLTIKINNTQTYNYFLGNGHKLVIGTGVTTITAKANAYFILAGGDYDYTDSTASTDLTVRSGKWRSIYAGGYRASVTGHVKGDISGCWVYHTVGPTYCGNIGSSEIKISDVEVYSHDTSAIYCGPAAYNGTHKVGTLLGESKLTLGDNVSAAAVYAGSREKGDNLGLVTIIIDTDSVNMPIYSRPHSSSPGTVSEVLVKLNSHVTSDLTMDTTVLDLAGYDITGTLTVDGTLTVKDSATDDYDVSDGVYGEITGTVTGTLQAAEGYLAAANGFHKFGGQYISHVNLRPGDAGIYYTATFLADEVLMQELETGVAVSLVDLPGTDFETDADTLYTAGTNSVVIENILTGDANDADRAIRDIYAVSYVKLKDGTVLVSDANIAYSLYDVLLLVRDQYPDAFESFVETHNIESWF